MTKTAHMLIGAVINLGSFTVLSLGVGQWSVFVAILSVALGLVYYFGRELVIYILS